MSLDFRAVGRECSNWGRWGPDDELGTPNLITPDVTKRALGLVQEGVTVSLSRAERQAADFAGPPAGPRRKTDGMRDASA